MSPIKKKKKDSLKKTLWEKYKLGIEAFPSIKTSVKGIVKLSQIQQKPHIKNNPILLITVVLHEHRSNS